MTTRQLMITTVIVATITVARPRPSASISDPICPPPQVYGDVASVDGVGERVELTVGSDDGLCQGHEMYVYQAESPSCLLGKLRIVSINYDNSSGIIYARNGARMIIKKGDKVSLYPRSPIE
jgi:hypothetical protein